MTTRVVHTVMIPCALAGLLLSPGCSIGPKTVSQSRVEGQIAQKMADAAGNKPESVSCPHDLGASVGATMDCQMIIRGQPLNVNVKVTSIEGDQANFDIVETIDKHVVANEISDQRAQHVGHNPESVTCPENLKGELSATLRCVLTDAGRTYGVTVTITSVNGGDVKLDIKVDNQPVSTSSPAPTQ